MPADIMTPRHFKALKAMVEVAGEDAPGTFGEDAREALGIILQHNPELAHEDPMDQFESEQDKYLMIEFIDATKKWGYEEDQGTGTAVVAAQRRFEDWRQMMIERLNRDASQDGDRLDYIEKHRFMPDWNNIPDVPGGLRAVIDKRMKLR